VIRQFRFPSSLFFAIHFTHSLHPSKPMLQPSPQLRTGLVGLLFLLTAALPAFGQISLAPTTLFIHDRTNVGELFVSNSSATPQEVNIRFIFGYPSSDSTGSIAMVYDDPSRMTESGLDSYIRVFPRRFVLGPGASQTVRVQALPMPGRGDGLFWTRAIVSSNQPAADVGLRDTTAIGAVFNYVLEQSIPIFYKKGKPTTGVDFVGLTQTRQDNDLSLMLNLRRDGTSPFLGTIHTDLIDASGNVVRSASAVSFLYYLEWRKVNFDVEGLPSGTYTVSMRFETQRRDMAPTDLVQAPTQTHSVTITL
jgi:P pilus assembly chaperone PapD